MSGQIEVRRVGRGLWAVFRDDRRITGAATKAAAEDRAARIVTASQQQLRPCITCRREFYSEGPHNRMCDFCRDRVRGDDGGDYAVALGERRGVV